MKRVASVVENALKIPTSPTPNSSDDSRQGQSTSCKLAACHFWFLFACYADYKTLCGRHSVSFTVAQDLELHSGDLVWVPDPPFLEL